MKATAAVHPQSSHHGSATPEIPSEFPLSDSNKILSVITDIKVQHKRICNQQDQLVPEFQGIFPPDMPKLNDKPSAMNKFEAYTVDKRYLAQSESGKAIISIYDTSNWQKVVEISNPKHPDQYNPSFCFLPSCRHLLIDKPDRIRIWDFQANKLMLDLPYENFIRIGNAKYAEGQSNKDAENLWKENLSKKISWFGHRFFDLESNRNTPEGFYPLDHSCNFLMATTSYAFIIIDFRGWDFQSTDFSKRCFWFMASNPEPLASDLLSMKLVTFDPFTLITCDTSDDHKTKSLRSARFTDKFFEFMDTELKRQWLGLYSVLDFDIPLEYREIPLEGSFVIDRTHADANNRHMLLWDPKQAKIHRYCTQTYSIRSSSQLSGNFSEGSLISSYLGGNYVSIHDDGQLWFFRYTNGQYQEIYHREISKVFGDLIYSPYNHLLFWEDWNNKTHYFSLELAGVHPIDTLHHPFRDQKWYGSKSKVAPVFHRVIKHNLIVYLEENQRVHPLWIGQEGKVLSPIDLYEGMKLSPSGSGETTDTLPPDMRYKKLLENVLISISPDEESIWIFGKYPQGNKFHLLQYEFSSGAFKNYSVRVGGITEVAFLTATILCAIDESGLTILIPLSTADIQLPSPSEHTLLGISASANPITVNKVPGQEPDDSRRPAEVSIKSPEFPVSLKCSPNSVFNFSHGVCLVFSDKLVLLGGKRSLVCLLPAGRTHKVTNSHITANHEWSLVGLQLDDQWLLYRADGVLRDLPFTSSNNKAPTSDPTAPATNPQADFMKLIWQKHLPATTQPESIRTMFFDDRSEWLFLAVTDTNHQLEVYSLKQLVKTGSYTLPNRFDIQSMWISGHYLNVVGLLPNDANAPTDEHTKYTVKKLQVLVFAPTDWRWATTHQAVGEFQKVKDDPKARKPVLDKLITIWSQIPSQIHNEINFSAWFMYHLEDPEFFDLYEQNVLDVQALLYFHRLPEVLLDQKPVEWMAKVIDVLEASLKDSDLPLMYLSQLTSILESKKSRFLSNEPGRRLLSTLILSKTSFRVSGQLNSPEKLAQPVSKFTQILEGASIADQAQSLLCDTPDSIVQYSIFKTRLPLDLSKGSDFSRQLFEVAARLPDSLLKSELKPLIYYKWELLFNTCLAYALLLWSDNVLAYIYLGYLHQIQGLGIAVLVLSGILVFFEIKTMSATPITYLKNIWNYFDLVVHLLMIATVIVVLSTSEESHTLERYNVWLRFLSVTLLSVRSLTWLRIFKPTRYMVTMVMEVFNDFAPFVMILAFVLIVYAYAWRLAPGLLNAGDVAEMDFYNSVLSSINLIFGNSPNPLGDDGSRFDVITFFVYVIGNVVLALVLMNFLIALISGTSDRVSSDQGLYDVKELLPLIQDFDLFLKWGAKDKKTHVESDSFSQFALLVEETTSNDEILSRLAEVESTIIREREHLEGTISRKIEALETRMHPELSSLRDTQAKILAQLGELSTKLNKPGAT